MPRIAYTARIDQLADGMENPEIHVYESQIEMLKALSLAQIARALTRIANAQENK